MSVDIYQWPEAVLIDETTEEYEYFEYSPDSETIESLNGIREIRFNIDALSTFIHPSKSFLYFEGQILRNDNDQSWGVNPLRTARDNTHISLANDGILHLFSEMKYSINGQPIEDILNPAISSIMLGMLRYPDDFSKSKGLMQCWFNPFPNKPWFLRVCSTGLFKTLWEKEKLLVMSNFSFSHCVLYSFGELSTIFIKFEIVVLKRFQYGRV